jgi:D-serine deaminase-like pyridoxal phosphate-dependent protein
MSPWSAALPGDTFAAIDTPALVLDLDAFERNLDRMSAALADRGLRLRPHAKSHKCPEIARRQVARGAVGICCQKVSEAAAFASAGIEDVLITNEIVGPVKLRRLAELAARVRVGVLVDDVEQVAALAEVAHRQSVSLDVYVEVDVGGGRCGVTPGDAAARLALEIDGRAALRFAGLHCYQGSAQHLRSPEERRAAISAAAVATRRSRDAIEGAGLEVRRITGAGTGSFVLERDSGLWDEIQAGSYIFMDRDYADNVRGPDDITFEHALFVLTAVMSRPTPTRAVVDAGLKASSVDSGLPTVWQQPGLRFRGASDEHGVIEIADLEGTAEGASRPPRLALADRLLLVPGHCDPTVNLYDEMMCVRGLADPATARVEAIWPISARGALV